MGKGKRSHTISTLNFPRSMIESGLFAASHMPLPAILNTTPTVAKYNLVNTPTAEKSYRWRSAPKKLYREYEQKVEAVPLYVLVSTYLNYFILILFGHLRDFIGKFFKPDQYSHLKMNKVSISIIVNS